ncbi:nucleoside deaminase [Candidatus Avelusimicrobium facis]|uniref:nucleoside deaminase n=1 Tax=Candidatus Avelusimicrobium facis TaxID=3416203 RepID=UPI003D09B62C
MNEQELQMHKKFLEEAVRLARENVATGRGGPFGAVIVKDGQIIASGSNQVLDSQDPTMHAEVNVIRQACKKLNHFELKDCIIYSSCEPCPMCLGAIYWARPKALFFAADRSTAARHGFDDKFIYDEIALPAEKRSIKTVCIALDGREQPFEKWDAKTDKVPY